MKNLIIKLFIIFISIISLSIVVYAETINQNDDKKEKQEKVKKIIVSGIVKDEQGNLLDNVYITLVRRPGEEFAAIQTADGGKYQIYIDNNRTILFSLTGYESKKVDIKGKDIIDIILKKTPSNNKFNL
jgi:hypothetical protein